MLTKSIMTFSLSYLLGARLSLVIKSVLLFYSSEVGPARAERYELIAFDNGDEGPNAP